jgi:hypothetical protein
MMPSHGYACHAGEFTGVNVCGAALASVKPTPDELIGKNILVLANTVSGALGTGKLASEYTAELVQRNSVK